MANPLRDFFFGTVNPKRADLVEAFDPRRTFNDVVLPKATRRALDHALLQIQKHDLIFYQWGLSERHTAGLGLAFNFAGPPGTGKTICAEAIAHALDKKLLLVSYSELESLWAGETGKNVATVFRSALEQDAVLFFDEADAIAGRRFSTVTQGYQREANTVVNVLLKELEEFDGVVIFATNLASNFDPAFERRIRTHILFEQPGPEERAKIWSVQLHPRKTPLAPDVDFEKLGNEFVASGGDIKNAVLKAAQFATAEPGPDADKKITQRHFEEGMKVVLASKKVMEQSLFDNGEVGDGSHALSSLNGVGGIWSQLAMSHEDLESVVDTLGVRVGEAEQRANALGGAIEVAHDDLLLAHNQLRDQLDTQCNAMADDLARQTELQQQLTMRAATAESAHAAAVARLDAVEATVESSRMSALKSIEVAAAQLAGKLRFFQVVTISMLCLICGVLIYVVLKK